MGYRPSIDDKWTREYLSEESQLGMADGILYTPYTFIGVYEKCFSQLSKFWRKDKTIIQYEKYLNNIILPHIKNHNEKNIFMYSKEDIDDVIEEIREEEGYINSDGIWQNYEESTIQKFRFLIYTVFKQAALSGYCKDILWGTQYQYSSSEREKIEKQIKTIIKKSLTIEQEKRIVKILMKSPKESGLLIGLLLMFAVGNRDQEAVGLDYQDIYELPDHKGRYFAIIRQTVKPGSNEKQIGGKSPNAGRRIPIPSLVAKLIMERKKIIEQFLKENDLKIDINKLPVAGGKEPLCAESDFTKRLRASDLTDAAKDLFKEIGLEPEVLSALEVLIDEAKKEEKERQKFQDSNETSDETIEELVKEKNPTAYLFRRNFATHLKILNLELVARKYLMGHDMKDEYKDRSSFNNNEKLFALSEKLRLRPLLNEEVEEKEKIKCPFEKVFSGRKELCISGENDSMVIRVNALEMNDNIIIESDSDLEIKDSYKTYDKHKEIDVIQKYIDDYKE